MFKYTFCPQHDVTKVVALLLSLQLGEEKGVKARFLIAPHLSSPLRRTIWGKDYKTTDKYVLHRVKEMTWLFFSRFTFCTHQFPFSNILQNLEALQLIIMRYYKYRNNIS